MFSLDSAPTQLYYPLVLWDGVEGEGEELGMGTSLLHREEKLHFYWIEKYLSQVGSVYFLTLHLQQWAASTHSTIKTTRRNLQHYYPLPPTQSLSCKAFFLIGGAGGGIMLGALDFFSEALELALALLGISSMESISCMNCSMSCSSCDQINRIDKYVCMYCVWVIICICIFVSPQRGGVFL